MATALASGGLAQVIAGTTAICELAQDGPRYRGYEIADLAEHCAFEEVAHLLLHGELPTVAELRAFRERVTGAMLLPPSLALLLDGIRADVPAVDVLRTAVSFLAHADPDRDDASPAANLRKSERLLGQIPAVIGHRARRLRSLHARAADPASSHAENVLRLLTGRDPEEPDVRVMNLSLVLHAEHEFNASTFAARVIVSTLSDLHSGVVGAIGALKGPLHGGANEAAMRMLLEIGEPARAEPFVEEAFRSKRRIMGFGHRIYRQEDHRARLLEAEARKLAEHRGLGHLTDIADIVAGLMVREKGIFPNLDWPAARAYYAMGLPMETYTPLYVSSRVSGWCAHIIEQLGDNHLIRPSSVYNGPEPRVVSPIDQRLPLPDASP